MQENIITAESSPLYGSLPASVFADHAAPGVSSRYVFVDSREILELMTSEGFVLDNARGMRHRKRDPLFGPHLLDFRHPDLPEIDGCAARVMFSNAHNRGARASFMMGLFRWLCANGLFVGSVYAREQVRHAGEQARTLIERVRKLAKNTGPLFAQVEDWSRKELTPSAEIEFATLAAQLRFGDAQRFNAHDLLTARREGDEGRTLWRVLNRVQENAMKGGLEGRAENGRALRSRPITAITADVSFNSKLWQLAAEFAE